MPTIPHETLTEFTVRMMKAAGASDQEALVVADHLVQANLYGVDSHGVIRIVEYIDEIENKRMKTKTSPKIVKETKTTAVLDAQFGFGQVAARTAMELAIEKARDSGIGGVTVYNCGHTGRVGAYPVLAAKRDMVGIVWVKGAGPGVSPYGGKSAPLGTSPFSWAAPTSTDEPVFADYATSVSSEGKIRVMMSKGLRVPQNWLLNKNGDPTTDPADLYAGGSILTFGAHKGYALNLMVEALGGALSGGGVAEEFRGANGVFAQAINIEYFVPVGEFKANMDKLARKLRASPPQEGFTEVMVPGDPEYREMKKRSRDGIYVNDKIWGDITNAAEKYHVALPPTRP
jgi:LDH2 family malate/lactate/ureidoglycolate dehydrogenase